MRAIQTARIHSDNEDILLPESLDLPVEASNLAFKVVLLGFLMFYLLMVMLLSQVVELKSIGAAILE